MQENIRLYQFYNQLLDTYSGHDSLAGFGGIMLMRSRTLFDKMCQLPSWQFNAMQNKLSWIQRSTNTSPGFISQEIRLNTERYGLINTRQITGIPYHKLPKAIYSQAAHDTGPYKFQSQTSLEHCSTLPFQPSFTVNQTTKYLDNRGKTIKVQIGLQVMSTRESIQPDLEIKIQAPQNLIFSSKAAPHTTLIIKPNSNLALGLTYHRHSCKQPLQVFEDTFTQMINFPFLDHQSISWNSLSTRLLSYLNKCLVDTTFLTSCTQQANLGGASQDITV